MLIGISGKMGAGKDTVAQLICELSPPQYQWKQLRFAARLKEVVASLTGTSLEDNYTRSGKQKVPCGFTQSLGQLQQQVGMALRAHIDEDIWINATLGFMDGENKEKGQCTLITDVRFPNEYSAIFQRGGIVIRVVGDPLEIRRVDGRDVHHISECALDEYFFTAVLENTGTLNHLRQQVQEFLNNYFSAAK